MKLFVMLFSSLAMLGSVVTQAAPNSSAPATLNQPQVKATTPTTTSPTTQSAGSAKTPSVSQPSTLTDPQDLLGYSIGMSIAENLLSQDIEGNKNMIAKGFADVLMGKPTLISKAQMKKTLQDYVVKMRQQQMQEMGKKVNAHRAELLGSKTSPMVGNPKGKVTLIEFFDYQCVHCRNMVDRIEKVVKQDPELRVIFKEFPIFGANSNFAARAALAANMQGKYWPFHNALLSSSKALTKKEVLAIANKVGLNIAKLKRDIKSKAVTAELQNNFKLAKLIGINGTPGFILMPSQDSDQVSAIVIPGEIPLSMLQENIEKMQNKLKMGGTPFKFPKTTPQSKKKTWQGV